jgi:putative acetyltransferase
MVTQHFTIRHAVISDHASLKNLYQQVAQIPGGIARQYNEIDDQYIDRILTTSLKDGVMLVVELQDILIGSIHAYRLQPRVFTHMLSELTIVIHPNHQGQGIGRALFTKFLDLVKAEWSSIVRVELMVRESNTKAIVLYESLGFVQEGVLRKRIMGTSGNFEADICMGWINPEYGVNTK